MAAVPALATFAIAAVVLASGGVAGLASFNIAAGKDAREALGEASVANARVEDNAVVRDISAQRSRLEILAKKLDGRDSGASRDSTTVTNPEPGNEAGTPSQKRELTPETRAFLDKRDRFAGNG
jgi:hypothetical protein